MNDLKGIIEDCNKSDLVCKKVIKKVIEIIGQEEWNDLHDEHSDICTTMGELIITLEGIPDLEKENAELKAYNEKLLDGDIEKHNKIVELQRENAILKKELEISQRCWQEQKNISLDTNCKLHKAKEIIKRLLKATYGEGWNYSLQVKVEAEKFLKESE